MSGEAWPVCGAHLLPLFYKVGTFLVGGGDTLSSAGGGQRTTFESPVLSFDHVASGNMNSGHQAWQLAPLLVEPSLKPVKTLLKLK